MGSVFDHSAVEYDLWYDKHNFIYQSEINALEKLIPEGKKGIEIGAGTGRFSTPFKITIGVEPSANMAKMAEARGITVLNSFGENLPFHNESFGFVLMVTTVCFLNDMPKVFSETFRILKYGGKIILGIIDKNSPLGKEYEKKKSGNKFYVDAHFHSTEEITLLLKKSGFSNFDYWQTLMDTKSESVEKPQHGYGKGSFVVIGATK